MEIFDAILKRRSIRKYKDTNVPEEIVEKILKAGMAAPSAHNEQPWQFVIVDDKKTLEKSSKISPYSGMAKDAPLAILVCGDMDFLKTEGFWPQDLGAAVENMLLAVTGFGLGAVWTGIYPRDELVAGYKKLLDLPENVIPFALVVMGYPDIEIDRQDRFKKERIHYNKW